MSKCLWKRKGKWKRKSLPFPLLSQARSQEGADGERNPLPYLNNVSLFKTENMLFLMLCIKLQVWGVSHHNFWFQEVAQLVAQALIQWRCWTTKSRYHLFIGFPCQNSEHLQRQNLRTYSAPNAITLAVKNL